MIKAYCRRCRKRVVVETVRIYSQEIGLCKKCADKFWKKYQKFMRY